MPHDGVSRPLSDTPIWTRLGEFIEQSEMELSHE